MRLILGRAHTGKSTYIYDEIQSHIESQSQENLVLIVPDLMTYQSEYDIINRFNTNGIMNIDILSFKRLAYKIFQETEGVDLDEIDDFGRIMILKKIFNENQTNLKIFQKASNQDGFISSFNDILQELKENLIAPEDLEKILNNISNDVTRLKLEDFILIYKKYMDYIKDKFIDAEDKVNLVIDLIKKSDYLKNSIVWIDGFESFSKQRIKIIDQLNKYSKSVTLALNMDKDYIDNMEDYQDSEAFNIIYETIKSIEDIIDNIEYVDLKENKNQFEEIKHIEKNLFLLKPEKYPLDTDKITIYSSMNPYTEIEHTAMKIVDLVRDKNYRWKDIKIATGDIDTYENHIKKIFDRYDIPYFLDTKKDIMNHPLSKYILSLMDIFLWNFKFDNVFEHLKTGLTNLKNSEIALLENYAIRYGIEGYRWLNPIDFHNEKNKYYEDLRKFFIANFENEIKEFKDLDTIGEITNFIFKFLKKDNIQEKIQSQINHFISIEKYKEASEYSQVWSSVVDIFNQFILVGEKNSITPAEYRKILELGFKEIQIGVIPTTLDKVEIGTLSRVGVNHSKIVFIVGANEGKMESIKESGLLLDEEREMLRNQGIRVTTGSLYNFSKDKHMVYKTFTSAIEKLYVSYSLGTTKGKSLKPSFYVATLKKIFSNIVEESDLSNIDESIYISNPNGTYDYLVDNLRGHLKGLDVNHLWKDIYLYNKENETEDYRTIDKAIKYKNQVEDLRKELVNSIFKDNTTITVSKLESYASCPFKFFMENVFKAKPRPTNTVESYDMGNIRHGILEDFLNQLIELGDEINNLSKDDINQMIGLSIDKELEKQSKEIVALEYNERNKYLKEKIRRTLIRTAYVIVEQIKNSEFKPKFAELQIGSIEGQDVEIYVDSLDLQVDDKTVKLRGKVDRVDVYEDSKGEVYITVIDYKSSKKDVDLAGAFEGIQMQLLVYLKAILENGEKIFNKKPNLTGVFYYHVDDPIIDSISEDEEEIDENILKTLKLKGYATQDIEMVRKLDKSMESSSKYYPIEIKKDGEFSSRSRVLSQDEFTNLLDMVEDKAVELTTNILEGKFQINPYKDKEETPCKYCEYASVCQFDKDLGNTHRTIAKFNKDMLKEGGSLAHEMD